jgi:peptide/nickel transport system substrate-binding protein
VIENSDTDMLQFRSGGIDVNEVTSDYFSLLKREEKQRGFKIYNGGPVLETRYISFNLNKGREPAGKPFVDPIKSKWFNTVEFRQAIAYATNRSDMLNNIYQGLGDLQHSVIPVQSPYYLSPKAGLKTYKYDIAKAKTLLLNAGFRYGVNNELMDADGNPVRFSLITRAEDKIRVALGAQFKQNLANLGIQVDFNPMAFNALVDKIARSKQWECMLGGIAGGGVEPNSGFNTWSVDGSFHFFNQGSAPGDPPIAGREVTDWEQKINNLYIQGAQELNEAKRKAIYGEAQQIIQEKLPFFTLITPLSFSAVRDRIQNVKYSPLGGALWNIHELKIAEK